MLENYTFVKEGAKVFSFSFQLLFKLLNFKILHTIRKRFCISFQFIYYIRYNYNLQPVFPLKHNLFGNQHSNIVTFRKV